MGLFACLCILLFMSTIFGRRIDEVWEGDQQLKMADQRAAQFNKVKYGLTEHGRSGKPDISEDDYLLLDRIVGGSEALYGEIPWQASVQQLHEHRFIHICGAVIIDDYWLLSAAHCYRDAVPEKWRVIVGEHHLNRQDPGEQVFGVERIYNHKRFNEWTIDYDVALIKVKPSSNGRGIQFNRYVRSIRLPYPNLLLKDGTKVLVSGWGYTSPEEPQEMSTVLKKTVLSVVSQEKCSQVYSGKITDRMVCAGHLAGGTGACRMDSGGPLAYNDGGQYVLYGIVSWGKACAQPNIPGVYARVTAFLHWIEDIIKSDH